MTEIERLRQIAKAIIRARHCLIMGEVARALNNTMATHQWQARFEDVWNILPFWVLSKHEKYIMQPARNQIKREGLLAQNGRYKLHIPYLPRLR